MSTEETNGFSAPNEGANVAGADSFESASAGQAVENNETVLGADDTVQVSSEDLADDMSAFEEQIEDSDLATALERIVSAEDQLVRVNAELYNQGQEYTNYIRRSKEAIPGYKTVGQDEVIESLVSILDDIAAARAHGDLEDGPFASTATKFEGTLRTRFELECHGAPGDDFDPALHDVLMATTSPDVDHPVIRQVLANGYRRGERVVRAAEALMDNPERYRHARNRKRGDARVSEQGWFFKDFYKVLGVDKTADKKAITKAYRKLARQWHPDQNPGDKAAEDRFKEVGEVYTVLSNDEDRKCYDAIRAMASGGVCFSAGLGGAGGFEGLFGAFDGAGGSEGGGYNVRFQTPGMPGGGGFEDILSGLFGGGGGGVRFEGDLYGSPFGGADHAQQAAPTPEKGGAVCAKLSIFFRQALNGVTLTIKVGGSPIKVRIPADIKDGQKVYVKGYGKSGINGGLAGDLEVAMTTKPHPVSSHEGDDLVLTLPVMMSEVIFGTAVDVPIIDGNTVTVKVPAGFSSGSEIRMRSGGVKTSKATSDLIVHVATQAPAKPSRDLKKLAKEMATAEGDLDVRASLFKAAEE